MSEVDVKVAVRQRDGQRCTKCGMTGAEHVERFGFNLDVHRTIPGSEYTLEGCVTVCRPCHGKLPRSEDGQSRRNNKGVLYAELPPVLVDWLKARADANMRTTTAELRVILEDAQRKDQRKKVEP